MPCPAILQSGDSKGKVCGKKPKYGQYCGIHKNHQQKQRENAAAVGIASSSAGLRASSGSSSLVWHYHQPAEASDRTADPTAARSSVGNVARERRIWKRSNSKDDLLKLMADNCCGTAEQKDDGGSMKAAEVLVCQRRLIAKLWRNGTIRRASAYGYDWAKDLDLVAYLSPFARCKKIELEFIADSLGLQLTTPYEDTKADLLRAVVRAMEARNPNSGQSNLCAAVVEPTGENFRRALFEQVFFGADGLIDVLKAKPDKVVWEAKNALEWALADCMAITQASTGIMKNRVEWLKGLKKHLISADTVQAHPLKGAWDKAQEASKRVQWELATLNDFPEMYEKLAYHHVGETDDETR